MSSELLPNCSSPMPGPNLCDEVVTTAAEEEEAEVIHATAALSGGRQICIQLRSKNGTPAYQVREEIARRFHVDSDRVELFTEDGEIVGDFSPDEFGPFQYHVIAPDEEDEQELILEDEHKIRLRERKQLRERESQLRVSLLLKRSSTFTLPPSRQVEATMGKNTCQRQSKEVQ